MNSTNFHTDEDSTGLANTIRACTICDGLPLGPKPIFQFSRNSKILIAGQAPGRITHHKGIPFDDPSGNRLRSWLGVTAEQFYNPDLFAIVPMGFCFPGTGKSGDLPPRSECAEVWRGKILASLQEVELTMVVGAYAMGYHLGNLQKPTLTQTVADWRAHWPQTLPLPHPSPRNGIWLKKNPWFEDDVLPALQTKVRELSAA